MYKNYKFTQIILANNPVLAGKKENDFMMIAAVISTIILIFGGLNWALIGIFDWNMVTAIFGYATFTRIVYILIGLAALYMIYYTIMQTLKHENTKPAKTSTTRSTKPRKTTYEA